MSPFNFSDFAQNICSLLTLVNLFLIWSKHNYLESFITVIISTETSPLFFPSFPVFKTFWHNTICQQEDVRDIILLVNGTAELVAKEEWPRPVRL